jgi:hypothetical protein
MSFLKRSFLKPALWAVLLTGACVGDVDTTYQPPAGPDAGPAIEEPGYELRWSDATTRSEDLRAAMHYVSETEIYAVIGEKICMWNGSAGVDHTTEIVGLSASMHFVSPTQIYSVVGNKVCMWDGNTWTPVTLNVGGINDGIGTAEFHWVSDSEIYAIVGNKLCLWNGLLGQGGAWQDLSGPTPGLKYAMDFKGEGEIYVVIDTRVCVWNGTAFEEVAPVQSNLEPVLQVVSPISIYGIVGNKVSYWNGSEWSGLTDNIQGLQPEFYRTNDKDIVAIANSVVSHWANVVVND